MSVIYEKRLTALLVIDPINDFIALKGRQLEGAQLRFFDGCCPFDMQRRFHPILPFTT